MSLWIIAIGLDIITFDQMEPMKSQPVPRYLIAITFASSLTFLRVSLTITSEHVSRTGFTVQIIIKKKNLMNEKHHFLQHPDGRA